MAIFNENYILEMKSKEEYRKNSFKKKYNYKAGTYNKDIGNIKTKNGTKYKIVMNQNATGSRINTEDGEILLGKDFFKLKGSNHNERRDAVLQHEIGHHRNQSDYYKIGTKQQLKDLEKAKDIAKKYERLDIDDHINKDEPLADRYAANRTSKSAIKKGLRNINKINKDKSGTEKSKSLNAKKSLDYNLRSKALDDKELIKQYNRYDSQ